MNKYRKFYKPEYVPDLKTMLERAAELYGDKPLYEQIISKDKTQTVSANQLLERTQGLSTKLIDMGLQGKHISIIGENSIEWLTAYLSVVNCGCVAIPLDKELQPDAIAKQINLSDTVAIFSTQKSYKKVKEALSSCPAVEHVFVMREKPNFDFEAENVLSYQNAIDEGCQLVRKGNKVAVEYKVDPEAMCEIVFTSGTTGPNKGVMFNHKIICTTIFNSMTFINAGRRTLSVLPINHTYEKNTHVLCNLYCGSHVCFNDDLKHVVQNINRFSPNFLLVVPMFIDTIVRKVRVEAEKNNLTGHLNYGIFYSNLIRKIGIDQRKNFFKPILKQFGGRLNQIVCGGAPLSAENAKFLESIGINVVEGYGITECGPLVAANCTKCPKLGTVGKIVPTLKVRIVNPDSKGFGEIEVKGDNVMLGYYKDPESTKAVLSEDGWFKTGDIGKLGRNNYLTVSGRVKNLIILPNGKNISPEEIEDKLVSQIPYIKEVVVYADDHNTGIYASCYLDPDFIEKNNITDRYEYLMKDISKFNSKIASFKRITDVVIYDNEFEKTTTKKIQRFKIERRTANV